MCFFHLTAELEASSPQLAASPPQSLFQVRRWITRLRKGNIMLRTTFGYVRCSACLYRDVGSSQPAERPETQLAATPQTPNHTRDTAQEY